MVIVVIIGLHYIWNLNYVGKNTAPLLVLQDSTAFVMDIPYQSKRTIPPIDVITIAKPSIELISKGAELYKASCLSCHGETGKGDGPTAITLSTKPKDLTNNVGWKNGQKVTQLYKTLQEGISGTAMSSFSYLLPEELFAIIHYVRSLSVNVPEDTPDDLKILDETYGLSKGVVVTGQVPIKKATEIILKENEHLITNFRKFEKRLQKSDHRGASILREYIMNQNKASPFLYAVSQSTVNESDFIKIMTNEPQRYGIRPTISSLDISEWKQIYHFFYNDL